MSHLFERVYPLKLNRRNGIDPHSGLPDPVETTETAPFGTVPLGGYLTHETSGTARVEVDVTDALPDAYDLEDAVRCRSVAPLDPKTLRVPPELLDSIRDARTVLLIGHIHPDADCVGSTVALARALRLMGKKVDVCVDDQLSQQLRNVDDQKQVYRAADLAGGHWDLGIVMDTMVPSRLGGAIDLLGACASVGLVDHHEGTPDREALGISDDQPFHVWVDSTYAAAAMMSAALIGRFESSISRRSYGSVYEPALAGFATDTGFGELEAADRSQFGYFKFMVKRAGLSLATLRHRLDPTPPAPVAALIAGTDVDLPAELSARLAALRACGSVPHETRSNDRTVITVPRVYFDLLLDVGRTVAPDFNALDLSIAFKEHRDGRLRRDGGLAAVLFETKRGVKVSLRVSDGELAHDIADHLGGGGHKYSAAALVHGTDLGAVSQVVQTYSKSAHPEHR